MINQVFELLKTELNTFLTAQSQSTSRLEARVEFMSEEPYESLKFSTNCICPILIRIEEEKTLRPADRYLRSNNKIDYTTAPPAVPIHLYILFIASYKNYIEGLKNLSRVILFFQSHPTLSAASISENMPDLVIELQSLKSNELNEIWGMLRAPLQPSVIYKVTLLMMETDETVSSGKVIKEGGAQEEVLSMKRLKAIGTASTRKKQVDDDKNQQNNTAKA